MDIIRDAIIRLINGYGVEWNVPPFGRVAMIPSPLFRMHDERGEYELLITLEGKGAFYYTGQAPLNAFNLVGKGFPLQLAEQVVEVVANLFEETRHMSQRKRLQSSHNKKEKSNGSNTEEKGEDTGVNGLGADPLIVEAHIVE